MAEYSCIYCKNSDSEALYPVSDIFGDTYEMHHCKVCSAFFLSPNPTLEQLERAYDPSYYGESDEKFSSPGIEKVLDFFRQGRARRLKRYLPNDASVLDIGCGNGRFLVYLSRFGNYKLYGTELDGNSAKRAQRHKEINLKVGMLEGDDFAKNSLDAITMFHVFEHLTEPAETLSIIEKILKPGGFLLMSFPNIASKQSRSFKGNWLHLDPPRHLFYFAPHTFIKLMKDMGFKLMNEHYLSAEQNPFGMVQSLLNKWSFKREILFESLKGNKDYIKDVKKRTLFLHKLFFLFSFPFFVITDVFAAWSGKSATVEFIFRKNS